jgi:hypothetical protein
MAMRIERTYRLVITRGTVNRVLEHDPEKWKPVFG